MGRGLFPLWRRPTTAAFTVLAIVLASALILAAVAAPAGAQTLTYTIYDEAFAQGWEVRGGNRALADTVAADPVEEDNALEISLPAFCGSDGLTGFALFDDVLGPQLFSRYAGESHIFTWEALVEPEWDVDTWARGKPVFTEAQLRAFVANFAKSVHANSNQHATVNMAMIDALYLYTDLEQTFGEGAGLDYYSTSWYDYMSSGNWCALCRTYGDIDAQYGLGGKPLLIGEFYAGTGDYRDDNNQPVDAITRLNTWLDHGYAGAYAWSLFWDSTGDKMQVDPVAYSQFGQEQATIIGPRQLP